MVLPSVFLAPLTFYSEQQEARPDLQHFALNSTQPNLQIHCLQVQILPSTQLGYNSAKLLLLDNKDSLCFSFQWHVPHFLWALSRNTCNIHLSTNILVLMIYMYSLRMIWSFLCQVPHFPVSPKWQSLWHAHFSQRCPLLPDSLLFAPYFLWTGC